jgi:hypothetical protein
MPNGSGQDSRNSSQSNVAEEFKKAKVSKPRLIVEPFVIDDPILTNFVNRRINELKEEFKNELEGLVIPEENQVQTMLSRFYEEKHYLIRHVHNAMYNRIEPMICEQKMNSDFEDLKMIKNEIKLLKVKLQNQTVDKAEKVELLELEHSLKIIEYNIAYKYHQRFLWGLYNSQINDQIIVEFNRMKLAVKKAVL